MVKQEDWGDNIDTENQVKKVVNLVVELRLRYMDEGENKEIPRTLKKKLKERRFRVIDDG